MNEKYVIECRKPDGSLDFSGLQPEGVFGNAAITGISIDQMAKTIYAALPFATLTGDSIVKWPSMIDPRWSARRKYW